MSISAQAHARSGTMVIVMSSIGLSSMHRIGAAVRDRAMRFLDVPVSGGRAGAEAGTLTIIVGGKTEDFETARPLLEVLGTRLVHVGDVGAGSAVKMANQVLVTVNLLAGMEVARLMKAAEVPIGTVWDVLRTCHGNTWVVENWATVSGWVEHYQTETSLGNFVKDTGLALDFAREKSVSAPILGLASQLILTCHRDL
jgi:3-hydroxyisobutyrate dehydrogenase-like beta-hydroxyacid dehydrogenase